MPKFLYFTWVGISLLTPLNFINCSSRQENSSFDKFTKKYNQSPENQFNYNIISPKSLLKKDDFLWNLPELTYNDQIGINKNPHLHYYHQLQTNQKGEYPQLSFEDWYNTYDTKLEHILYDQNNIYNPGAPKRFRTRSKVYQIYALDSKEQLSFTSNNNNPLTTLYAGVKFNYLTKKMDLSKADTSDKSPYQSTKIIKQTWEHINPRSRLKATLFKKNIRAYYQSLADLHNIRPAINYDFSQARQNYHYGIVPGFGLKNKVHFQVGKSAFGLYVVEPRPNVRGDIARIILYMKDRYHLTYHKNYYKLMILWSALDPVTKEEKQFDQKIAKIMGISNPYVSGKKKMPYVKEVVDWLSKNK